MQTIDEPVPCLSCGNQLYFFIKRHYQRSEECYVDQDRGTADNTDLYSNLKVGDGKTLYYANCEAPVAHWRRVTWAEFCHDALEGRGDG